MAENSDGLGSFPPKSWEDIAAYDNDETVAGYREHSPDDTPPGPNHSPGYRWGWTNRRKDVTGEPDGFENVRREYMHATGMFATKH